MALKWIDTHTHLQASDFDADLLALIEQARASGVVDMVICAGSRDDWQRCADIAHSFDLSYMLGIHPLFTPQAQERDLATLTQRIEGAMADPHFIGIGEIGLDGFVPTLDDERQEYFFYEQLRLAKTFDLPISCHIRRSGSRLLKYFNRVGKVHGVLHAFNGSDDELKRFSALGLKFGFGGASTYAGSLRIRRHLAQLPATAWVLETDAPDIPSSERRDSGNLRTEPIDIVQTAQVAATLRGRTLQEISEETFRNALDVFPRLQIRH